MFEKDRPKLSRSAYALVASTFIFFIFEYWVFFYISLASLILLIVYETVIKYKETHIEIEGPAKFFILSFDDNTVHDKRLVELLEKHNVYGTFHINSGTLDKEGYLSSREIKNVYLYQEVSIHTVSHPDLTTLSDEEIRNEVQNDKEILKKLSRKKVVGMSYPFGKYDNRVVDILKELGILYSRTVKNTYDTVFEPEDYLEWHPTMHLDFDDHGELTKVNELLDTFIKKEEDGVFILWGHSWELGEDEVKWTDFEKLIQKFIENKIRPMSMYGFYDNNMKNKKKEEKSH